MWSPLPPSVHCQGAVGFLGAGKHVIVEKPMAPSLAECDVMIEAQKKSGKILSVISQNRFRVAPMRIKGMLEGGLFGPVLLARVNSMWWRGSNYYDLWWRGTYEKEGGGCTLNHAVHQIDILQWLVGMPNSVLSVMGNVAHTNSEVEDVSMSILRYDGMLGQVNSSLVDHDEKQEFFFAAEHASFAIPGVKAVDSCRTASSSRIRSVRKRSTPTTPPCLVSHSRGIPPRSRMCSWRCSKAGHHWWMGERGARRWS